jgi:hypothetical protein
LPNIHDVFRWWRKDVLKDLLILRSVITEVNANEKIRNFFLLGLSGILIPDLTNITLGRLQLHFIDRSNDDINVWRSFSIHIQQMIDDLQGLNRSTVNIPSTVINTDSTSLKDLELPIKIDRVITSPPYPNRYSYVWNTRPHLYFLNIYKTGKQAADLDKKTIGGTWGTATSVLSKGQINALYPIIEETVTPVAEEIRKYDNLMANYVMKYFNMLASHIIAQDRFLSKSARCAYVIGCSRIKEVYVESDKILGDIFEGLGLGYKVHKIERFRRRNSGKDLHESIVYAYKD